MPVFGTKSSQDLERKSVTPAFFPSCQFKQSVIIILIITDIVSLKPLEIFGILHSAFLCVQLNLYGA